MTAAGDHRVPRTERDAFRAVVLAGERTGPSPVAEAAGVRTKVLAAVGGQPMVVRVLASLEASAEVAPGILLSGLPREALEAEPELRQRLLEERLVWIPGENGPSASAHAALKRPEAQAPVLVTTADHALLRPEIVDFFCRRARATGADLVLGLARQERVADAFPGMRRTVTRFREGGYCGCNLFAFMTPESIRAAKFWRRVERQRKRPWRTIRSLGWGSVLLYLLRRLSLDQALERLSRTLGLRVAGVILPFPEAAVDVDSVQDYALVRRLARERAR